MSSPLRKRPLYFSFSLIFSALFIVVHITQSSPQFFSLSFCTLFLPHSRAEIFHSLSLLSKELLFPPFSRGQATLFLIIVNAFPEVVSFGQRQRTLAKSTMLGASCGPRLISKLNDQQPETLTRVSLIKRFPYYDDHKYYWLVAEQRLKNARIPLEWGGRILRSEHLQVGSRQPR